MDTRPSLWASAISMSRLSLYLFAFALSRSLSDLVASVAFDWRALTVKEAGRLERTEPARLCGPEPLDMQELAGKLKRPVTGSITLKFLSP